MAQSTQNDSEALLRPIEIRSTRQENDAVPSPSGRHPYRRQPSWTSPSIQYSHLLPEDQDIVEGDKETDRPQSRGLGLSGIPEAPRITRVPVGSKASPEVDRSPGLYSGNLSQATTAQNTPAFKDGGTPSVRFASAQTSRTSLKDDLYHHVSDNVNLVDHDHVHDIYCPTDSDLVKSQWSWFSTTILLLSIYSTIFSGIFLGISFAKPRWGERIGTTGHVTFSTASLLSALFSKTIELSFATVFVATLGQILSRKAFVHNTMARAKGGISIAEINMRLWIMQPGTLITNWMGVRYAATTVLGVLALLAAVSAVFYTTAAEALVAPKLKFGKNESIPLAGRVTASYANSPYLSKTCQTPINPMNDPVNVGATCLQVEHAGQSFHNFDSWLMEWADKVDRGDTPMTNGTFKSRPQPLANLYDNTTVSGQWITPSGENITADSNKHGRLFQNITMAMPHANLFHAVRDPVNHILQPDDLSGFGEYFVRAAVPAPTVNVLCVGMSAEEMQPMLLNATTQLPPNRTFETVVDKFFGWTQNPQIDGGWYAPWFPKLPIAYNTIVNTSTNYGPSSIYLLATPPTYITTNDYVLCALKSMQYNNCTTSYRAAKSGGQLEVHCDDDSENVLSYSKGQDPVPPNAVVSVDWKDVGTEWIQAISLGSGVTDGNASISRLITQMIPSYSETAGAHLDPSLPSLGEALGVLAGCTLLLSSDAAPFIHYWNYSSAYSVLESPQLQIFNATLSYKDYTSGGTQQWQGIFYIILVAVFALNCFCLIYLCWIFSRYGQVTDYTEPQNLFALAINSPPSGMLAGACGGGPSGRMLAKRWCVDMSRSGNVSTPNLNNDDNDQHGDRYPTARTTGSSTHPHFYVRCEDDLDQNRVVGSKHQTPELQGTNTFSPKSPIFSLQQLKRRSKHLVKTRSIQDFSVDQSPAVDQYMMLSRR